MALTQSEPPSGRHITPPLLVSGGPASATAHGFYPKTTSSSVYATQRASRATSAHWTGTEGRSSSN